MAKKIIFLCLIKEAPENKRLTRILSIYLKKIGNRWIRKREFNYSCFRRRVAAFREEDGVRVVFENYSVEAQNINFTFLSFF